MMSSYRVTNSNHSSSVLMIVNILIVIATLFISTWRILIWHVINPILHVYLKQL